MGGDLHAAVYDYANDQMVISVTPLWTGAGALRTRRRGSRWTPSGCGTRPTQAAPTRRGNLLLIDACYRSRGLFFTPHSQAVLDPAFLGGAVPVCVWVLA